MKTKNLLSIGIFILSLIYLTSCDDLFEERIDGNGILVTKERSVSPFNEVVSTGNFDVYITIADSTSLYIEAEENLFAFIITKVSEHEFYVEVKDNFRLDNNEPIKIYLTTPFIEEATLTGSGTIVCDSVTTDVLDLSLTGVGDIIFNNIDVLELDAEITGSGDIELRGFADETEMDITGTGHIRSLGLRQNYCDAVITGTGNMYVYVDDHIEAVITGTGSIYYLGNPTISKEITGTGNVKRY